MDRATRIAAARGGREARILYSPPTEAGVGVGLPFLPLVPPNRIIASVAGEVNIRAYLPVTAAAILVALSIGLTLLGGLIPSRKAARQDPVTALRSE